MERKPKIAGLEFPNVTNIPAALRQAYDSGFCFIMTPLAHPKLYRPSPKEEEGDAIKFAWVRSDLVLPSQDWQERVYPKISTWIDLDSPVASVRKHSEDILLQETSFFHHIGTKAFVVELNRRKNPNLMRALYSRMHFETSTYSKEEIWLQIPTTSKKTMAAAYRSDLPENDDGDDQDDPWHWWDDARTRCDSYSKLKVALELTADLPDESKLDRWLGEPLEVLMVPTSIFLTNKSGYPTLSKAHQRFVQRIARRNVGVVITGGNRHGAYKHYLLYLNHLYQNAELPDHLKANIGFEEQLQMPLQPLADHLESYTYEVFEKDPVKYSEYGRAVYEALLDRVPDQEAETNTQVIMVVGAGRGPLVTQAILAARKAKRKVRVYALDKNPNAIVTLTDMRNEIWGDLVQVVHCDMRKWKAPEKCDILVSELLGSLGDNELSPECLDGAQVHIKDDGISIPESYRSYICPTMSHRLYNEARDCVVQGKHYLHRFEQTYVVAQTNSYIIAPHKQLFEFVHPNRSPVIDNSRWKQLSWPVSEDCTLHGFSGYFDATLYKNVKLSITPDDYSIGMFSWFPIYVPISNPISLKAGDIVELDFWRRHDEKRVWYEWAVTGPVSTCIFNVNGRSSTIGL